MGKRLDAFNAYRTRMNSRIRESENLQINRFLSLDGQAYREGALSVKTKELLGLVASLVLRCDDCITYHMIQCADAGVTDDEFYEALNVGLVVGGSIVIPHMRRAVEMLDEIRSEGS